MTVGVLDGVHLGHRRLVAEVVADGLAPTVVTFDPHPIETLVPGTNPRLITDLAERIDLLASIGIERVAVLDLAEIRELSPETFVSEILVGKLAARRVVTGVDFQFGKNRTGNVALLASLSDRMGFTLDVIDLVISNGTVSSSRIRGLIETQRVAEAAELLGSRYRMTNTVIDGDKRGREIGFPTANLNPPDRKVIPGDGVYAALAVVDGEVHPAAVNVGVRPTFGGGSRVIEAYLLDYENDLYDKRMTLEFVDCIRDELRFDSIDDLITRMKEDVRQTRSILAETKTNMS